MTPAESENRFDDLLRRKLDGDELLPSAGLWPAVSATLPPPRPRAGWPVGATAVLGVLIGLLVGWWAGPRGAEKATPSTAIALRPTAPTTGSDVTPTGKRTTPIGRDEVATERSTTPPGKDATATGRSKAATGRSATPTGRSKATPRNAPTTTGRSATTTGSTAMTPTTARLPLAATIASLVPGPEPTVAPSLWQVALTQDAAIRHEGTVTPVQHDSASRVEPLVAGQRAILRVLQRQLDSLKAALPAEPMTLASADSVAPKDVPAAAPAASGPLDLPPPARWAVALLLQTSTPWGVLPGPPDTRETIGGARQQSLHVEHVLPNDRWRIRGGFGRVGLTSQFRAVQEATGQTQVSDTTAVSQLTVVTNVDTTRIIHVDSAVHLNPRINGAGQIIGYDSLWVTRYDTLYQQITSHDTLMSTTRTVSTRLDTWRETREQALRPIYRFWTLPVAVSFDVLRAGRWAAGVRAGAQVLLYRGGDLPTVRSDGTWTLRAVGSREGLFRPVSFALSTGLDVRYRLTNRLSVLAGAGTRGWVQSPVRGQTRPRMQPTAEAGLSWGLGGR